MQTEISKAEFGAKALEIIRTIEETGQPVLITEEGVPIVEIRRYQAQSQRQLQTPKYRLVGSLLFYDRPDDPVDI